MLSLKAEHPWAVTPVPEIGDNVRILSIRHSQGEAYRKVADENIVGLIGTVVGRQKGNALFVKVNGNVTYHHMNHRFEYFKGGNSTWVVRPGDYIVIT